MSASIFAIMLVVCTLLALLLGYPIAFTLAGMAILFAVSGYFLGQFDLNLLSPIPNYIYDLMTNPLLASIPLFVLMGVILQRSKIAADMITSLAILFPRHSASLGVGVVLLGALLAASTGVVGASVTTLGLLALPALQAKGYSPALASGTVAASGTLGQIIPPSIVLIFLSDQITIAHQTAQYSLGNFAPDSISLNELFAAALLPGLVLVVLYGLFVGGIHIWHQRNIPRENIMMDDRDNNSRTAISLFAPFLLVLLVPGSILSGIASPLEAAATGALGAILLGYIKTCGIKWPFWLFIGGLTTLIGLAAFFNLGFFHASLPPLHFADWVSYAALALLVTAFLTILWQLSKSGQDKQKALFPAALSETMMITTMIFTIVVGARIFAMVFRGFGGDTMIENIIFALPGGTQEAIIFVMIIIFVLGFFLEFIEISLIVIPIVAPVLLRMTMPDGSLVNPVWLAILIAINFQTSFLTPPFGVALFYLREVADKSIATWEIYKGVIPFILLQLATLLILWLFPALALWLPALFYGL